MSKNLKVRFGVPSNGWLPVHIETPAADIDFLASYVKDSLTELAEVLNLLCVGISDHIVIWELEPQQMVFSFIGGEENLLTFSIEERSNRSQTDRLQIQKHIEYTASADTICTIFWRALRRLETSTTTEGWIEQWGIPFPSTAVAQLKKCLSDQST